MCPWSDATETLLLCAVAGSSHGAFFFPESLTQQKERKTKQVEKVNRRLPSKNPSFAENRFSALDFSVFPGVSLTCYSILGGGWGMCGWK
jgi:hypothetical protein